MEPFTVSDEELEAMYIAQEIRANAVDDDAARSLGVLLGAMLRGLVDNGFSPGVAEQIVMATYIKQLG